MDDVVGELVVSVNYGVGLRREVLIRRADERVLISELFLHAIEHGACAEFVSYGDGILTIRALNGIVSYGVGPPDYSRKVRLGIRSGPARDDVNEQDGQTEHEGVAPDVRHGLQPPAEL